MEEEKYKIVRYFIQLKKESIEKVDLTFKEATRFKNENPGRYFESGLGTLEFTYLIKKMREDNRS